jgi:hypothetical protein
MKQIKLLLSVSVILMVSTSAFTEENKTPSLSDNFVLEVMWAKGRPFAYQRIGGWTWYDGFQRVSAAEQSASVRPVEAVKLYPREEAGAVKVKVTVLRGANLEFEDVVSEYTVGIEKVTIGELAKFGVAPFEIGLVRAPATTAYIPKILNNTKSLVVSIEPIESNLPAYRIRVLNSSSKPVACFSYNTFLEGRRRYTGMPQQFDGTPLITPGSSYEKVFPYALATTTQSTGEVPQPIPGLQLNVLAVIFTDGTYEGDRLDAARFRGYKIGERIQLTRILAVLRSKSAESWDTLAPSVDAISYKITISDIEPVLKEFPGLPEGEAENIRSAAEVSAAKIEKDFVATFGTGKKIDPTVFSAAVNAAIAKCQKWLDGLP